MPVASARLNSFINPVLNTAGNLIRCFSPSYTPGRTRVSRDICRRLDGTHALTFNDGHAYLDGQKVDNSRFFAQSLLEHGITELKLEKGLTPRDLISLSRTGQTDQAGKATPIVNEAEASQLLDLVKNHNLLHQLKPLAYFSITATATYMAYRLAAFGLMNGTPMDYALSVLLTLGIGHNALLAFKNQSHVIAGSKYKDAEASESTRERVSSGDGPKITILVPALSEPIGLLYETLLAAGRQNYENKEVVLLLDDPFTRVYAARGLPRTVNRQLKSEGRPPCVKIFERKKYENIANKERNKADNLNAFFAYAMGNDTFEFQDNTLCVDSGIYLSTSENQGSFPGKILQKMETLSFSRPEYVVVIDADYKLKPEFATETVAILEENDDVALVQTPQNLIPQGNSDIERISAHTISAYWQLIKRGNAWNSSIFWGGTNTTIRMSALETIKRAPEPGKTEYIPTKNITEDLYTTLLLIREGWETRFISRPLAEGKPIENLPDHFSTYWRYVEGTTEATLEKLLPYMFRNPRFILSPKGRDLLFHGTQSLSGLSFAFFMMAPTLAALGADFPPMAMSAFLPFFLADLYSNSITAKNLIRTQGAKRFDHILAGLLFGIHFPVYAHGIISAVLNLIRGKRAEFLRTPKYGGEHGESSMPLKFLLPLLGTIGLNLTAFIATLYNHSISGEGYWLHPAGWALLNSVGVSYGLHKFYGLKHCFSDLRNGIRDAKERAVDKMLSRPRLANFMLALGSLAR